MTNLEILDLASHNVPNAGLEHLKGLTNLKILNLENNEGVSDLGLVQMRGLTNLRELNLNGTKATAAGIQELQKVLPKVQIIHVAFGS